jgi:hypothetical protein
MSKWLDRMIPGKRGGLVHTLVGEATGTAVYAGASYGLGYVMNAYPTRARLFGGRLPLDLAVGVSGLGGAVAMEVFGRSNGGWVLPLVRDVGRAGIGAFCHTLGAGHGAQKSGLKRLLIPEGDVAKARAALPNATFLGVEPKAPHGDYMSTRQLLDLAR